MKSEKNNLIKYGVNTGIAVLLMIGFVLISGIEITRTEAANPPAMIAYQGRIYTADSVPLASDELQMQFAIYNKEFDEENDSLDPNEPECLWSNDDSTCATMDTMQVNVSNFGRFNVLLGGGGMAQFPDDLFADNQDLYLQVWIEGDPLFPRRRLVSAPFAMNAGSLGGFTSDDFLKLGSGDNPANNELGNDTSLDLNGNILDFNFNSNTDNGGFFVRDTFTDTTLFEVSPNAIFNNPGVSMQSRVSIRFDGADIRPLTISNISTSLDDDAHVLALQGCNANDSDGCEFIRFERGAGGFGTFGTISTNGAGGLHFTGTSADFAELFPGNRNNVEMGDVLGIDESGQIVRANAKTQLIGAYSVNSIVLGNAFDGWREDMSVIPVGLLGQAPVKVNIEGGAIQAGDFLTISSVPGVAKKANNPGMVIGRALEDHAVGSGIIDVYVSASWNGLDAFAVRENRSVFTSNFELAGSLADEVDNFVDSPELKLTSAFWDGQESVDRTFSLRNTMVDGNEYVLDFLNHNGSSVASFTQDGDLKLAGALFPGDRGVMQNEKYIFYDSSGEMGDFMRTNAAGWGTGSYDFAEMFPSSDPVFAGEVVVFSDKKEHIQRSPAGSYNNGIAGIVSTRPGFLAGENKPGHYPIALVGRVPTNVTTENGAIKIGDPLTTSDTMPGFAMKATEPGQIVGFALEDFDGGEGSIIVYVRPSYFDGSESADLLELDTNGSLSIAGQTLTNIDSLIGLHDNWRIENDGTFVTRGLIRQILTSLSGIELSTFAVVNPEPTIQLTGSVMMVDGRADIDFAHINKDFKRMVEEGVYQVFITPNAPSGRLYVSAKNERGFVVREVDGNSTLILDWLVIAYPYGYQMPETQLPGGEVDEDEGESSGDNEMNDDEGDLDGGEDMSSGEGDFDGEDFVDEENEGDVDNEEENVESDGDTLLEGEDEVSDEGDLDDGEDMSSGEGDFDGGTQDEVENDDEESEEEEG